ncbi:unnamed protein product [Rhizoctonia solani]|uniref:Uncharacterized protein n=1 Tax=Rhizoctonia solani TaxID=456999 RepID=A0A8H3HY28_9AGAM|nr:unnamed protein product [Rhizoctonia solani]
MVQIPTRTRTLSFSVREAGCRPRPVAEEPDAKRARRHAPLSIRSTPLAPKSVNLTVTAVPVPFPADQDDEWGTDTLPSASNTTPRGKKLVAKTVPRKELPPPPPAVIVPTNPARSYTPSPLTPDWKPPVCIATRQRKGRIPPEPLARKALKAHFARTPHGAAVIKLGARRAIAQAECVAAVERVRKLSGERPTRLDISPPVLLPPVLMDADLKFEETMERRTSVRFPTAIEEDSSWVPLSVQSGAVPVDMEECDIVEMETDDWARI